MKFLFQFFAPLLILSIGIFLAYSFATSKKPIQTREDDSDNRPIVRIESVSPALLGVDIETDGVVYPYKEIDIAAQVSGKIVEKSENCRSGRFVKAGMPLIKIDPTDYELALKQATHELEQTVSLFGEKDVEISNVKHIITIAEEEYTLYKAEEARQKTLREQNVVTESDYDQSRRAVLAADTALSQLRNQLNFLQKQRESLEIVKQQGEVRKERAMVDLERTIIFSPIDGIVVEDLVEKDSFVGAGKNLVKLEETSIAEIRTFLKPADVAILWDKSDKSARPETLSTGYFENNLRNNTEVNANQEIYDSSSEVPKIFETESHFARLPVTIRYKIPPHTFEWTGFLDRYDGSGLDNQSRMFPFRVVVPEPRKASDPRIPTLLRGMYVSVIIHTDSSSSLLKVPTAAVQPGNRLFLVQKDGDETYRIRIVPVQIVKYNDDSVLIRDDAGILTTSSLLVISPLNHVTNGMEVRLEDIL